MNLIRCEFPSDILRTYVRVTVLLPKPMHVMPDTGIMRDRFPALYLLHGAFDYGESWLYHTNLAEQVDTKGIEVVLPSVGNSFYLNEPEGPAWFTYLTEELPEYLDRTFPLSRRREDTFLGGLSMGGYGSLYGAVKKPERYGKVFSLSGSFQIRTAADMVSQCGGPLPPQLRDQRELPGGDYDLFSLLDDVDGEGLPRIFLACGTEDFFIRDNCVMAETLERKGAAVSFVKAPGDHSWTFWRKYLDQAFDFLWER